MMAGSKAVRHSGHPMSAFSCMAWKSALQTLQETTSPQLINWLPCQQRHRSVAPDHFDSVLFSRAVAAVCLTGYLLAAASLGLIVAINQALHAKTTVRSAAVSLELANFW
jgi:hypothetical protein